MRTEQKEFQLTFYGQLIVLALQLHRTAGVTSLIIVTQPDDEMAYLQHRGIVATYVSVIYRIDHRHVIWVERRPGLASRGGSYTLVEFDRTIAQGIGGPEVMLSTPSRTPLSHDQLQLMQSRLEGREGERP